MKRLREFTYHEPATLAEAVGILVEEGSDARVLAGGTDLVVDMKTGRLRPSVVVNLKGIPGLGAIEVVYGGTRIGALTRVTEIQASARIREHHPATATIDGPDGSREEAVEDLYAGPGQTTLATHDIISSIFIPDSAPGFGSAHLKIGARASGTDIAIAGVSAGVAIGNRGTITAARIVLASVAPTPMRAVEAEQALIDSAPVEDAVAAAGAAAAGECRPISDLRASGSHRIVLIRVLTMRALRKAIAVAGEAS